MKKKNNILLIGCGFFSQNIYMPIINKKFERQNVFFFDERKDLKKRTALKNKCNYLEKINQTTLKKNNITHCILCFDRSRSYQIF